MRMRLFSGVGRRLRALDRADIGRGAIALLMVGGLAVALLVLVEVRHLSRAADDVKKQELTAVEVAAETYAEISTQIGLILTRISAAELANRETAAGFHGRQDELLERTQATEREVAALITKVETLIAVEESRRAAQLRFERWLEQVEADTKAPVVKPEEGGDGNR